MAASQIAMRYGLHGPSLTVTTACASSLDALGHAAWLIDSGKADVIIAGGTDGGISLAGGWRDGDFVPATFYTSTLYGMIAPSADPRRAMLPFDVKRSGIVVGEGSAMHGAGARRSRACPRRKDFRLFPRLWQSRRRLSSLGAGTERQVGSPRHGTRAADAGIAAADVDALIAHATGTPKGDTAEIRAINRCTAGAARSCRSPA